MCRQFCEPGPAAEVIRGLMEVATAAGFDRSPDGHRVPQVPLGNKNGDAREEVGAAALSCDSPQGGGRGQPHLPRPVGRAPERRYPGRRRAHRPGQRPPAGGGGGGRILLEPHGSVSGWRWREGGGDAPPPEQKTQGGGGAFCIQSFLPYAASAASRLIIARLIPRSSSSRCEQLRNSRTTRAYSMRRMTAPRSACHGLVNQPFPRGEGACSCSVLVVICLISTCGRRCDLPLGS